MRTAATWIAAAAIAVVTAGCIAPATTSRSYTTKATMTVEAAVSEVETVRIAVEAALEGRVFGPFLDETVSDAEDALGSIGDAFGSVQPPATDLDQLRDKIGTLLSDAEDAVAQARLAARRHDERGLHMALVAIEDISGRLSDAESQLS